MARLVSFALPLVALAAACGGGNGGAEDDGPPPKVPACAGSAPAIARPGELRDDFPLPRGTVLRSKEQPFPGQTILRGVAPAGLDEAASFFETELPDAGYQLGRRDAEAGERESLFTGNGIRGGWRVRSIPDCDAVQVTLVLIRQPTG